MIAGLFLVKNITTKNLNPMNKYLAKNKYYYVNFIFVHNKAVRLNNYLFNDDKAKKHCIYYTAKDFDKLREIMPNIQFELVQESQYKIKKRELKRECWNCGLIHKRIYSVYCSRSCKDKSRYKLKKESSQF